MVPPGAGPAVVRVIGAANSASADDSDQRSDLGKAVLPPQANPSEGMVAAYRIASYQNGLAWALATSPQPKLRDARKAVELAEQAVARVPKAAEFWNTLGVARYRNGDWKAAIAALTKSTELQGENAHDSFFQAMARWQLGDKEESRRWHDGAVAWMEAHRPADEELRRFRAESTELMKVGPRKD
jgi:tetratricopeptide (TPR) repeat protein